jgi:hypothetical protein
MQGKIAFSNGAGIMSDNSALKPWPNGRPVETLSRVRAQLSAEQLECLGRCAAGISLRFEAWEIVNALVAGAYVERQVAGVITITALGREYLRSHANSPALPFSGPK